MKFLIDHMLGKLVKYLRFMGYDAFYPSKEMDDNDIIKFAEKQNRIIITRDKELAARSHGFYINSNNNEEQLKTVIKKFKLKPDKMLTRCSICNEILVSINKQEVSDKIPRYVYENKNKFYKCLKCKRVYWYGTHTKKIQEKIKRFLIF